MMNLATNATNRRLYKKKSPQHGAINVTNLVVLSFTGIVCLYGGFLIGYSTAGGGGGGGGCQCPDKQHNNKNNNDDDEQREQLIQKRIQLEVQKVRREVLAQQQQHAGTANDQSDRFPTSIQDYAAGMARTSRDDFITEFATELGVPYDASSPSNNDVLLLYQSKTALPSHDGSVTAVEATSNGVVPPYIASTKDAVQNCDFLNVVLTDHSHRKQCIAVMGQYEAFHIQKLMRLPRDGGKLDSALPLRFVNRGSKISGGKSTKLPTADQSRQYWGQLMAYLRSIDDQITQLRPLLEKVVDKRTNSVIVLVCNFGQSELLMNFICSAQRRQLDLSSILVFATDEETYDLVRALQDTPGSSIGGVYYDPSETSVYHAMPKGAARRYADKNFMAMMTAKLFCVHICMLMGYNVMFQDVDVVWYRNPLDYFTAPSIDGGDAGDAAAAVADDSNIKFDIYQQDDGNHALYYAPYSANTGFYYVKNNDRTRNFFNALLMQGDLILSTKSHQVPFVALLQEHASLTGLKVKIFSRDDIEVHGFPGGHAFHRKRTYMKQLLTGKLKNLPFIMHMSWTLNKKNKLKYFQQMGEWWWADQCAQKSVKDITSSQPQKLYEMCCAKEPVVTCHYRDKPSKIPCKDSPPIDKGGRPFW